MAERNSNRKEKLLDNDLKTYKFHRKEESDNSDFFNKFSKNFNKENENLPDEFENFDIRNSNRNKTEKVSDLDDFEEVWSKINHNKEKIKSNKSAKSFRNTMENNINENRTLEEKPPTKKNACTLTLLKQNEKKETFDKNDNINEYFTKKEDELEFLKQNMKKNQFTGNFPKQSNQDENNSSFETLRNKFNVFPSTNKNIKNDKSFLKHKEANFNSIISNNNINNSNINLSNKINHLYQNIINCEININADPYKPNQNLFDSVPIIKTERLENVISPSNLHKLKSDKNGLNGDSYGINKELLKKIITNNKQYSSKRPEKNKMKQKMEENKKLLDLFFTKRSSSGVDNGLADNLREKNNFSNFYSKINGSYSLKDLNYFNKQ
jgi:hypothetical protein